MTPTLHSGVFLRTATPAGATADVWLVHGFGESGLSFHEAFASPLATTYNLYVPDLPGSGVTPKLPEVCSVSSMAGFLGSLLTALSGRRRVVLVGHSLGGLIAVDLARHLGSQLALFVSVEGNLTSDDTSFSGLAVEHPSPTSFYEALTRKVIARFKKDDGFRRYYASLRFADIEVLWHLGQSGVAATGDARGAEDFLAVPARKAYYWGGTSLSKRSRKLLSSWVIPKRELPGAGHWPMVTQPERFYEALVEDVAAALAA